DDHIDAAVAFLSVAVLAGVAGAAIGWFHPSTRAALVAAIGFSAALPLVHRLATGTFDIFEPIVIANVAFLVMYVARPAVIVADGRATVFKGIDISPELDRALWIAFVGVAAFQVGYMLPWAKRFALRTRLREGAWLPDVTTSYAVGLLVLAVLLFGSFIHGAGGIGFLSEMLKGRSDSQDAVFRHSSAYLYA